MSLKTKEEERESLINFKVMRILNGSKFSEVVAKSKIEGEEEPRKRLLNISFYKDVWKHST